MNGYNVIGKLVIGGLKAEKKGKIIAEAIFNKTSRMLEENNFDPFTETKFDLIGTNSIYGPKEVDKNSKEIVLRIMVKHVNKEALILFSKEIAQAVTGMAAGVMNYMGGRPKVSRSIHLHSFLLDKSMLSIGIDINSERSLIPVHKQTKKTENKKAENQVNSTVKSLHLDSSVPLIKIAYARSGDKGDHANIGIIARKPEYLPFIKNALTSTTLSAFFNHVLKGSIEVWDVPGISGINFLLKHSLGGGGMASFNIDPQGKAYAQQILEYEIPITSHLANKLN
jgi:hypothetical protein